MTDNILEIRNLKKYFPVKDSRPTSFVKAVDDVSLTLRRGEVLGLVGESGCGKSTLVNTVLNLNEPTSGSVSFDGKELYHLGKKEWRETRKDIQIVFQDPFWSLNPRMLVKDIVAEPLQVQTDWSSSKIFEEVLKLLEQVGLSEQAAYQYPHEFSGGQRQRIAIARALALTPKLIVLDEPTSSIDVMSQRQILDLLKSLQKEYALSYIIISHDLSVVSDMSDRIAVMYLGKLVEFGSTEAVFNSPAHPYTEALFAAIPDIHTRSMDQIRSLEGNLPSAIHPPTGCRFHTRCPYVMERCKVEEPKLLVIEDGREVACHLREHARSIREGVENDNTE